MTSGKDKGKRQWTKGKRKKHNGKETHIHYKWKSQWEIPMKNPKRIMEKDKNIRRYDKAVSPTYFNT
jgi:hypothetical protein